MQRFGVVNIKNDSKQSAYSQNCLSNECRKDLKAKNTLMCPKCGHIFKKINQIERKKSFFSILLKA